MRIQKVRLDCDLTAASLDSTVHEFVEAFGYWPSAVIGSSEDGYKNAYAHAKELGLAGYVLPGPIMLNPEGWVVVGQNGDTIWSPGA